jgi:cytochrome c-type biogenesis protein CcmE
MVAFTVKNMIKTLSVLYAEQMPVFFHEGQGQ